MSSIVEPLFQILLTLLVAWALLRLVRMVGRRSVARAKGADAARYEEEGAVSRTGQRTEAIWALAGSILAVVVWGVALFLILGNTFGINLTPLLAGAGILSLALGFGSQDLVKDFVAGTFMIIEDQFSVGDIIDVGDATGIVEKITFRTTRIRDVRGVVWHISNGEIRRVGNLSQEWSRALLDIVISYWADIDQASDVIRSVAEQMAEEPPYEKVFLDRPEVWGVESVGADGLVIRLVIKTVPGEQWRISRELRRRIKMALDEAGIDVFSRRTLTIQPEEGGNVPAPPESKPPTS